MNVVRLGDARDVAAIMPVMDSAFDPLFGEAWTAAQCLATMAMPGAQLLVAQDMQRTTGFALSRAIADEEELLLIGVLPESRRHGVGRALVERLLAIAKDCNRSTVFLEVREGNSAEYFYRMMGFQPIGRRKSYYHSKDGNNYDAITMATNF
jgi:[ribosomal protein S18]-alanine N-acetyltransferase